jgi:excisionase family DNA binding protein
MSLGEAARVLGVAPTTLRRWADDGVVRSFVTPGGHRRFVRSSIAALVPADRRDRPSLERLGETPERMARAYRRSMARPTGDPDWLRGMQGADRDPLREHGRGLSAALLGYLDGGTQPEREARLAEAADAAAHYGRLAHARGATIHETVAAYLRFSRPFIAELATLARRRNLDTAEATELLESTLVALDTLLLATIDAHQAAATRRPRRTPVPAVPLPPTGDGAANLPEVLS